MEVGKLIIVKHTSKYEAFYYGKSSKIPGFFRFGDHQRNPNKEICNFINSCPFVVNLKDYKSKEICAVFYCTDKERAMYVSEVLCDDGENREDIEVIERGI